MTTIHHRAGKPGTGTSTQDPAAAEAVFLDASLRLLEPLDVAQGDVVVDVGPGAGSATVALAQAVGDQGRVYAVDLDPAMLDATLDAAQAAGVADRIRPVLHDLEDGTPSLPEAADAVWSSWCVHHARDWDAAVRALSGMLRPGGVLCLAEGGYLLGACLGMWGQDGLGWRYVWTKPMAGTSPSGFSAEQPWCGRLGGGPRSSRPRDWSMSRPPLRWSISPLRCPSRFARSSWPNWRRASAEPDHFWPRTTRRRGNVCSIRTTTPG